MRPPMKPAGSVPALLASFGRAASPEAGLINRAKAWLGRVRNGVLLHVVLVVLAIRRGRRQRVGRASAYCPGASRRSFRRFLLLKYLQSRAMTTWPDRDGGLGTASSAGQKEHGWHSVLSTPRAGVSTPRTTRVLPSGRRTMRSGTITSDCRLPNMRGDTASGQRRCPDGSYYLAHRVSPQWGMI